MQTSHNFVTHVYCMHFVIFCVSPLDYIHVFLCLRRIKSWQRANDTKNNEISSSYFIYESIVTDNIVNKTKIKTGRPVHDVDVTTAKFSKRSNTLCVSVLQLSILTTTHWTHKHNVAIQNLYDDHNLLTHETWVWWRNG